MAYIIPSADSLVDYLKDFTGSNNDAEIRQCIFQAELAMRNIELPALRSDPYSPEFIGEIGENGLMPIPADMNKPILFFLQGDTAGEAESNSPTGPWMVFDRVGDRDIISLQLVSQFYLNPANVPAVIRGKFSEVGNNYSFVPYQESGTLINMYYYRAWPLLFSPAQELVSAQGTVSDVAGASFNWTATISNITDTSLLAVDDTITATAGTGSLGSGIVTVTAITDSNSITVAVAGPPPTVGTITNILVDTDVQNNQVLQTFPEGYVYGALSEYYIKRHNSEDAQIYKSKFDMAVATVEDQNNLGKWSGGTTRLTSIFQPRRNRYFNYK